MNEEKWMDEIIKAIEESEPPKAKRECSDDEIETLQKRITEVQRQLEDISGNRAIDILFDLINGWIEQYYQNDEV